MKVVGPTMITKSMIAIASAMLMLERILMPLSTPVQAEMMKATVIAARMIMLMVLLSGVPKTSDMPLRVISVPMASDPAMPKTTAMTPMMSEIAATLPVARLPSSGPSECTIGVETMVGALRRKEK